MKKNFKYSPLQACKVVLIIVLLPISSITQAQTANVEDVKALARIYSAAFDREPSIDGLNFWVDSFEKGRSFNSIANDFYNSPEFTKKYGPISDTQYVELLYRNVLGRDGAQSGINFWVDHLENGTSRAMILANFAQSPENIAKTNEIFANMRFENGEWIYGSYSANASISGLIEEGLLILVDKQGKILRVAFSFEQQSNGVYDLQPNYFTFSNIPVSRSLSLFYIADGEIYALFGGTTNSPRSNVFSLGDAASINLGLVHNQTIGEGRLLSQYSMFNQNAVVAQPGNPRIPIGLERPTLEGLSIEELTQSGVSALYSGWITGANAYLGKVVSSTAPRSSRQADIARFYLAFSQLAAIAVQSASDGNPGSLNRIGDILDLLSIPNDLRRGSPSWIEFPDTLDQSAVTAEQINDWFDNSMRNNTARATNLLGQVSPNFNVSWVRKSNRERIENDYGDALFFLGTINLLRAYVAIFDAYNLEADINDLVDRNTDDSSFNDYTVQQFLNANPRFLSLASREQLTKARDLLVNGAINNLQLAIDSMQSETDPQDDDLISLSDLDSDELRSTRSFLENVKKSVSQGQTVIQESDSGDRSKDLVLDLKRFFNVGIDFRGSNLLPALDGDELDRSRPCLPDPTFNGVVISPDLDAAIYDDIRCN